MLLRERDEQQGEGIAGRQRTLLPVMVDDGTACEFRVLYAGWIAQPSVATSSCVHIGDPEGRPH